MMHPLIRSILHNRSNRSSKSTGRKRRPVQPVTTPFPTERFVRQPERFVRQPSGQAIILIAISFMALMAIVALAVDLGRVFIARGSLGRAVDAASLAAASQFREGRQIDEMEALANQVMNLNGVVPDDVIVEDCSVAPGDPQLCVTPRRKLVRVTAFATLEMTFLQVLGFQDMEISADSIAEAASVDVVLAIDLSESMTSDAGTLCDNADNDNDGVADDGRPLNFCGAGPAIAQVGDHWDNYKRDPSQCNIDNTCQPFEKVRSAANRFVQRILDLPEDQESDRIALVTFTNGWLPDGHEFQTKIQAPGWTSDQDVAMDVINDLRVFQPDECPGAGDPVSPGTCINHDISGNYIGINCPMWDLGLDPTNGPASCTTTNIGGALRRAGNALGAEDTMRADALWVVIVLTDGAANASDSGDSHPFGFCPEDDWDSPFCRDDFSYTRHISDTQPLEYDADDYARDNAEFVGCYSPDPAEACRVSGQSAVIFTIGLGSEVMRVYATGDVPHGVSLLRYAAAVGDDGDPASDPCEDLYDNQSEWQEWCGNYYFDASGDELDRVFEDIASRIFTRLSH